MDHYVGIDLHSTNSYIAIIDNDNKKIFKKKTKNDLRLVEQILKPYPLLSAIANALKFGVIVTCFI